MEMNGNEGCFLMFEDLVYGKIRIEKNLCLFILNVVIYIYLIRDLCF